MANHYEIPLSADAQRFKVLLSGIEYQMTLIYRPGAGWVLDIANRQGVAIVSGVPLVTGADLLAQYAHLGFSGRLWVRGSIDPDEVPTFENLGSESFLFWVTD